MIHTHHLTYGYRRRQSVLDDINLDLPCGHVYGLLGKNGVGKSTLLKLLSGALIGYGDIDIDGHDPRRRRVTFLQSIRLVHENERIYDLPIEALARATAPFYPTFDDSLFRHALEEFDVPARQRLTNMSLGQQKKALIALAVACNTPYLFMDEPTNGMDIPSKATFRRLMASLTDERKTVVISTHQVDDLDSLIDAVVILAGNGVLLCRTLQEVGMRLTFGPAAPGDDLLYSEPTLRGVMSVALNRSGYESPVDLKLLFNATVTAPAMIHEIFAASPIETSHR